MSKLSDLRLSKNMKYTALYIAMRYFEFEPSRFVKEYGCNKILIDTDLHKVIIDDKLTFFLDSHESFVKLECIDRLLSLGYTTADFESGEEIGDFSFKGYKVKFVVWDDKFDDAIINKNVLYKSRLVSGVLEYKTKIYDEESIYEYGLFEQKKDVPVLTKAKKNTFNNPFFILEENRVMKYIGKEKIVVIPEGIEELESSSFWDNQSIEEVVLPSTLKNMGGDTFYNCKKLKRIVIPENVELMGNNPFAGCPDIEVINKSPFFKMINDALYTADMKTMIFCSIKGQESKFTVPEGVRIIGKHTFYLCDRFEKIILPSTLEKMENNPFSGCSKLSLEFKSKAYFIQDDVIYNGFKTAVVGTLNKITSKRLVLLDGIKTINRNSFWNCKGIETIVFPESLEDIGYNPFVGCSNIRFESKSVFFKVVDGVLYNKDCSKIICYPSWKAQGVVSIPETVITLERGAFSGCDKMTAINLHNVNIINKSCFTNCISLKKVYCSDLITYIGEWAFAYCKSLETISVYDDTIIDNNALSNCLAELLKRSRRSNYLIESDNIYTLKSMGTRYTGKIDSILIDPPYNSHIDYIGYKDDNYTDGYLSFMEARIALAYKLLSDTGFLIINIDDGELKNLVGLCEKYFTQAPVEVHKWKKKHPFFDVNRVVLNPNKIQTDFENMIVCRKTSKAQFNRIMQPYIEDGKLKETETTVPLVWDYFGTTSSAKDEINDIFGRRDYFSTPKPLKLMKELIRATTNKSSIVMDFFAGSGTVGHACMDLNNEDGGERTFILVCNNESNICEEVANKRLEKYKTSLGFKYEFLR